MDFVSLNNHLEGAEGRLTERMEYLRVKMERVAELLLLRAQRQRRSRHQKQKPSSTEKTHQHRELSADAIWLRQLIAASTDEVFEQLHAVGVTDMQTCVSGAQLLKSESQGTLQNVLKVGSQSVRRIEQFITNKPFAMEQAVQEGDNHGPIPEDLFPLVNYGNTCFVSASVQLLYHSQFRQLLMQYAHTKDAFAKGERE